VAASLGLAGAAAVSLALLHLRCLVVRDQAGMVRLVARLPREGFALRFRHSVTREPVYEYLREAPGGGVQLYATAFRGGGGAGLPFDEPGAQVTIEGGWIVMRELDRRFASITLHPVPLTEHVLLVGGRQWDLLGLLGSPGTAVLTVEARPALQPLWGRLSNSGLRGAYREREGP
jgi:hypothetical protein